DELSDLRKMLEAFRAGQPAFASPLPELPVAEAAVFNSVQAEAPAMAPAADDFASIWGNLKLSDPVEIEALAAFKEIMPEIQAADQRIKVLSSLAGIFPIKKYLRNGTPEQKLFVLNVLGDRFLHGLAGFAHPVRKKLLKAAARFLSGISEIYSFLSMEGEPFNLQYHERVPLASASGQQIREMHGFLVVAKDSRRVVRLGQVLT
ncbi:MAG: hypothetical protein PHD82_17795, partial [Candidatus Riflebacteria bacterium]|nr:hypothetical protein [Candidatus Riflebacteria bacterium]